MPFPLRRIAKALAIGTAGSVAVGLARSVRPRAKPAPAGQASWEPLTTPAPPPARSGPVKFTHDAVPEPAVDESPDAATEPTSATTETDAGWVEPDAEGACPLSHPIKANAQSGIFHLPEGQSYGRTKAERCYANPAAAEADGFRQAKR